MNADRHKSKKDKINQIKLVLSYIYPCSSVANSLFFSFIFVFVRG